MTPPAVTPSVVTPQDSSALDRQRKPGQTADESPGCPRLVATDLDGTLLHSDGTITARTRRVLRALDRRGVPVVFVTARPLRWMEDLWDDVGRHGLAVVSNGAIRYDVAAREVREVTGIDAETGLALVDRIRKAVPEVAFAIECLPGLRHEAAYVDVVTVPPDTPVGPLEELWTEPAVKLLVQRGEVELEEFRERVVTAVGELAVPTWSGGELVEISAAGVTKAQGLAGVCRDLGIEAAEVVAFGDMPNDVAMLTWAGTSYAMAGAPPELLAVADHVAPGNDDDGVATVLAELFGLGLP